MAINKKLFGLSIKRLNKIDSKYKLQKANYKEAKKTLIGLKYIYLGSNYYITSNIYRLTNKLKSIICKYISLEA